MLEFLTRYRDAGLLLLRLGIGVMFIIHGGPKLLEGPELWTGIGAAMKNFGITWAPAFWGFMAAFAETAGGACLILGFMMRPACILLLVTMIVAATFHLAKGDGIAGASHAIEAGVLFASLLLIGPGRYSIDRA